MELINEAQIKKMIADGAVQPKGVITVRENQLFTPSAVELLHDKNIRVVHEHAPVSSSEPGVYDTIFGGKLTNKPEHMTHLKGNTLVFKDHPVIRFRGALDGLEAEIICTQLELQPEDSKQLLEDLEEIISLVRKLIRIQITGEPLGDLRLQGLDSADIREYSHHTTKHFGIQHFLPSHTMGKTVARLNRLRTMARKAELIAYDAFKDQYGNADRSDIIEALNRLSSVFWIMMCKYRKGLYKQS